MTRLRFFVFASSIAVFSALGTGCAGQIPNTTVSDTPENRRVVEFMETYRRAVEERDVGALMAMAHERYLDDNGTPDGRDDLDFDTLREKLTNWRERVRDVRYEIKYHRVSYQRERVYVEFRYTASFRIAREEGEEQWSRRLADHRVVLQRIEQSDEFRVLSGM